LRTSLYRGRPSVSQVVESLRDNHKERLQKGSGGSQRLRWRRPLGRIAKKQKNTIPSAKVPTVEGSGVASVKFQLRISLFSENSPVDVENPAQAESPWLRFNSVLRSTVADKTEVPSKLSASVSGVCR